MYKKVVYSCLCLISLALVTNCNSGSDEAPIEEIPEELLGTWEVQRWFRFDCDDAGQEVILRDLCNEEGCQSYTLLENGTAFLDWRFQDESDTRAGEYAVRQDQITLIFQSDTIVADYVLDGDNLELITATFNNCMQNTLYKRAAF